MAKPVAQRHAVAVDLLDIAPGHHVLEIGCGHDIATGLAAAKLTTGTLVAIDRSAKMTEAAARRNASFVATGRLSFLTGTVEDLDFPRRFDRIFAVNVDFPRHEDLGWAAKMRNVLKTSGAAVLLLEAPTAATAETFGRRTHAALEEAGLSADIVRHDGIVAVRATGT